jgi:cytochrome c oxidase subunit 2
MKKFFTFAFLDAATPWQIGFQDPATPIIIGIIHFHNHLIFFLVIIATFVLWLIARALILFDKSSNTRKASIFTHSTSLEIVWTIIPAILLVLIAGPSFALLYSIDEVIKPHISLKVIGHQWYWSYEYSDYININTKEKIAFDSYMVSEDDLSFGGLRLLEVDHRVKLPTKVHIRVLVSSADVLHSWAVPSLGIKIDACPGRLNQVSLYLLRKGVFYGQCSEICGVNHGFMPIVVESIDKSSYINWVKANLVD